MNKQKMIEELKDFITQLKNKYNRDNIMSDTDKNSEETLENKEELKE